MGMRLSLQYYIDLITVLTAKDIKLRYNNSTLGYLWSVANPLAFALVYYFAFKVAMRIDIPDYTIFLISGLFPWQWLSNSLSVSALTFASNASLIKKVYFPRHFLVLSVVLQDMLHFVLTIPVITLFLLMHHKTPHLSWLYEIPILLVIQFFMAYGLSLAIASLNLFFRDLEKLVVIFTSIVFFCTPILFDADMIPARYHFIVHVNPFAPLMISWRTLFLHGTIRVVHIIAGLFFAFCFYSIGTLLYKKLSWRFAEIL
jgi:lipopolysaccharide transport system permease protein